MVGNVVGNSVPRAMLPNPYRFGRICARRTADVTAVGSAPGLLELRPAPAGLPDPNLVPPTIAESGDPFAALRIVALLARIERARPVRIADIVDRLNAIHIDWIFPAAVVADVAVQLQANWMTDYRNSSGIVVDDGEYGPTIAIEDSPNGVTAAKRAGMRCVAIPNSITARLDLTHADVTLDSLADVTLGQLLQRFERP